MKTVARFDAKQPIEGISSVNQQAVDEMVAIVDQLGRNLARIQSEDESLISALTSELSDITSSTVTYAAVLHALREEANDQH